jgi:ribosomal protein S18 acetylase RimI-like enzyme
VIHYRSFTNCDSPIVVALWGACLFGRRVVPVQTATLLEFFTLAKPYFDPNGLILALDDHQPVGFVHAGFGVNATGTDLDTSVGVICTLGVVPARRRQGIGSELLRRAEEYLRGRGARELLAGPQSPNNPFTFALSGGCDSPGFLASDTLARPFFEKHGYQIDRSAGIFQRALARMQMPSDPRFPAIRQKYDIIAAPYHHAGWWRECVLGPIEAVDYRLQEKGTDRAVASCVLWDMETFGPLWGQSCVGMIDLVVEPAFRRQGLARYLLAQILRHLREQPFQVFEAQALLDNTAALGLLQGLGFQQVDVGQRFRRGSSP